METLFWALLCLLSVVTIYTAISTAVYVIVFGVDFWSSVNMSLKEFLFWK